MKEIKLPNLSVAQTRQLIPEGTILSGYRGSRAHNTYIPSTDPSSVDDIDIISVFVPDLNFYFGLQNLGRQSRAKERKLDAWDAVSYEVRKFIWLLLKANPNVLSLLWLRENMYIHVDDLGRRLIENRNLFISKLAYKSFTGYANGQMHRMTHSACKGRMGEKRKALVEKYGYDIKNAAHLIRLLRMGIEFLTEGKLHVFRHDAAILKEIKRGEWSLEKVKEEAVKWFELANEAYVRSSLPSEPDFVGAEKLAQSIIMNFHKVERWHDG